MTRFSNNKNTRFSRDSEGLVEFPFKILIIAIILIITLPLIFASMERFERINDHNQSMREMDRIVSAIIQVYSQGENASLVIEVEFPDDMEYVKLGDRLEAGSKPFWRSLGIYYKFRSGPERRVPVESGLTSIPVTDTAKSGSLEFGSGSSKLQFIKLYSYPIDDFYVSARYLEV